MADKPEPDVTDKRKLQPTPVDTEELLDWDFYIKDPPPPKSSGRIFVTLRRVHLKPRPAEDPRAD